MKVFNDAAEIVAAAGSTLGSSEWLTITQDRIDLFADATGDRQWIHVDPERATDGPFGATVAHGYLTLSLLPFLGAQVFAFAGNVARVNYGLNTVRFITPVRVGSKVRNTVDLLSVEKIEKGQRATLRHTVEIRGEERPACVAETVSLLMEGGAL
ncbi:MaoC family dehydratase [Aeromicrobium alkaliterrae]|uniref:MaoC family dehydratase n=1 Tax=Aeromicrobium alkaliterrae TaxID=302168 RepID=A0ABN2KBA0_9ACTN